MSCLSEKMWLRKHRYKAFTLVEAVAAITLIGIMASSVLVVFIRCSSAVRDSSRRMQAFEVARENMETLLGANAVSEQVEYGFSEKYPAIQWTKKVEAFFEPGGKRMWLRAVCSAEYDDSAGETKNVEFTHWLTELSAEQMQEVLKAREQLKAAGQTELTRPETQQNPNSVSPPNDLSQMTPEQIKQWLDQMAGGRQ
jgi:type II secretory pathway pseudopilin PulG